MEPENSDDGGAEQSPELVKTSLKLSDLTAAKQQVLTGAGITITAIGLTATAAGSVGLLLPGMEAIAPGAKPLPVYIAAIALPLAGFDAFHAADFGRAWKAALLHRLASIEEPTDLISSQLHDAFMAEISRNYSLISKARKKLLFGATMLIAHVYSLGMVYLLTHAFSISRKYAEPEAIVFQDSIIRFIHSNTWQQSTRLLLYYILSISFVLSMTFMFSDHLKVRALTFRLRIILFTIGLLKRFRNRRR